MNVAYVFITVYLSVNHLGNPLFCDRGQGLTYNIDTVNWVALPPAGYGEKWFCGDEVAIWSQGRMQTFLAYDSWVHGSCIIEGDECIKIGADIPEHLRWWEGLSTRALIVNKSEAKRRLAIER